jgi:photosynthetic reaction center H subunit
MSAALTESADVAQVVLYAFWAFFFGLIYWLRMEDRREGYPLESDVPGRQGPDSQILIPKPKTFKLPSGEVVEAPNFERDRRPILATRTGKIGGSPMHPTGNALLSNVGPASYAQRSDTVELTREGHDLIVPMRVADDFDVSAGPDPRKWNVLGADGKVAGTVKDLWVDRADVMVRYLEVELSAGGTRLLPITMSLLQREARVVEVASIYASQFGEVPTTKEADRLTTLEEERICAYYAGGRLYADASRLGPVV